MPHLQTAGERGSDCLRLPVPVRLGSLGAEEYCQL